MEFAVPAAAPGASVKMSFPSGAQFELIHGNSRVVVTEVGATLRLYEVAGRSLLWGFGENEMCSAGRGQVLAPWPNRLGDGSYNFGGIIGTAAIDDPNRRCAIHGLVRWLPWEVKVLTCASVQLGVWLAPQPAYPFSLHLTVTYTLADQGLEVRFTAYNDGPQVLPFGIGFHPYLATHSGDVDSACLSIPAAQRILLDGRGLPRGIESVEGTPYDLRLVSDHRDGELRSRRAINGLRLSDCFTDLTFGVDGRWRAIFDQGDLCSTPVVVWGDRQFCYIMCFTGDTLAEGTRRRAVAVEPMTCPPNALGTGDGLLVLKPGEVIAGSWGIDPFGGGT